MRPTSGRRKPRLSFSILIPAEYLFRRLALSLSFPGLLARESL